MIMVNWEYRKKHDVYEGYVGRMKVFLILEKVPGEWVLKFLKVPFMKTCRFSTPSSAIGYAEKVIDRIQKNFHPEELKKSFQKSD